MLFREPAWLSAFFACSPGNLGASAVSFQPLMLDQGPLQVPVGCAVCLVDRQDFEKL